MKHGIRGTTPRPVRPPHLETQRQKASNGSSPTARRTHLTATHAQHPSPTECVGVAQANAATPCMALGSTISSRCDRPRASFPGREYFCAEDTAPSRTLHENGQIGSPCRQWGAQQMCRLVTGGEMTLAT